MHLAALRTDQHQAVQNVPCLTIIYVYIRRGLLLALAPVFLLENPWTDGAWQFTIRKSGIGPKIQAAEACTHVHYIFSYV